jgi:hypothetical protein
MIPTAGLHIDQAPPLHIPFRFFTTAPLFLLLAGAMTVFWHQELLLTPWAPTVIAIVHLAVLGWITMTMMGAIYQMIPVLAATPVPWIGLAPWVHGALTVGVLSLFLELGFSLHRWLLLTASAGFGIAIILFLVPTLTALKRSAVVHPTVDAKWIALIALGATLGLGGLFLGEYAHGFYDLDRATMIGIHLVLALFGWVSTLILGVSFQVLPMFYVMPALPAGRTRWILRGWTLSLIAIPIALWITGIQYPETAPGTGHGPAMLWFAALPGLAALVLYGITMTRHIRLRKRRRLDTALRFWFAGYGWGALAVLLLVAWPVVTAEEIRYLFVVCFLLGWVSSVILGMMYKIVPFLVWFHRFSRQVGLVDTVPMMDDLVQENHAHIHFRIHQGTVVVLAVGVMTGWSLLLVVGGIGMIASGAFWLNSIRYALQVHVAG